MVIFAKNVKMVGKSLTKRFAANGVISKKLLKESFLTCLICSFLPACSSHISPAEHAMRESSILAFLFVQIEEEILKECFGSYCKVS